jgi:CRP/FNR family transcriptional regulator, cyclic AMP receptor protein
VSLLKQDVEILRRVPLFSPIDTARLKLLAFTSQRLSFDQDQVLFRQNESGETAYVLIDGTADVFVNAGDREVKVASVGRNEIIGEIAILCDVARTATVRTTSKVEALVIQKDQLIELLKSFPDIAIAMIRVLALRVNRTNQEVARLVQAQRQQ